MSKFRIAAAGNTEVPAYLALLEKGYSVRWERLSEEKEFWFAAKDDYEFVAEGPIELLGIAAMFETRGPDWRATDEEIEGFMKLYE
jgi:hypothetical protein